MNLLLIPLLIATRMTRTLFFFFFNDTATTEIYTLSLHDALPISPLLFELRPSEQDPPRCGVGRLRRRQWHRDRKSTRLNSSHVRISYAVFCLKKKKNKCALRLRNSKSTIVTVVRMPDRRAPRNAQ